MAITTAMIMIIIMAMKTTTTTAAATPCPWLCAMYYVLSFALCYTRQQPANEKTKPKQGGVSEAGGAVPQSST